MARLRINGLDEEVTATTVVELLTARGVDPTARFLAVAVNGTLSAGRNGLRPLSPGDNVEIVRPFSGG